MADFASPAWIAELQRAASSASVDPDIRLVVEQRITGPEPVVWHLDIADGAVTVHEGGAEAPTVSLSSTAPVAAAIHAGRLSPQRAFLDGDLRIGGDIDALLERRDEMAAVAAAVRALL